MLPAVRPARLLDATAVPRRHAMAWVAGMAFPAQAASAGAIDAVYPRMPERPTEAYPFRLLKAALQASGRRFSLRLTPEPLPSVRAFRALQLGEFNVMDVGAARKLAEEARVLPFPLDLGLSGYRLLLVRRDQVARLQAITRPEELRQLRFGQGRDWVDANLMRAAGLQVDEAEFLSLFRMLEAGRFDAFPLGADEAASLLERYRELAPSVVLFDGWCLHYRFARVFIVQQGRDALYDALHAGLQRLFSSGQAQALLAQDPYLGPLIDGRQRLPAPLLELTNDQWTAPYQAIPEKYLLPPSPGAPR